MLLFSIGIFSELLFGYYFFQIKHQEYSATLLAAKTILTRSKIMTFNNVEADSVDIKEIRQEDNNPFVTYPNPKRIGLSRNLSFHPFIVHTGAIGYDDFDKNSQVDYFGFRNDSDLYFMNRNIDKDVVLIVLSGGSEAYGYQHHIPIAKRLEDKLNAAAKSLQFRVLNLAMKSYTVADEINAYMHLAYQLKPEFVISYTGANDIWNAMYVQNKFRELGLFYMQNYLCWLPQMYELKACTGSLTPAIKEKGLEMIVDGFLKNVEKYRTIVHANGGKFFVGIQALDEKLLDKTRAATTTDSMYNRFYELYQELRKKVDGNRDYVDFSEYEDIQNTSFFDFVHSNDETGEIIAQRWANIVLSELVEGVLD